MSYNVSISKLIKKSPTNQLVKAVMSYLFKLELQFFIIICFEVTTADQCASLSNSLGNLDLNLFNLGMEIRCI